MPAGGRHALTLIVALAILAVLGTASADALSKPGAKRAYKTLQSAEKVKPDWTGSTKSCAIGTESPRSIETSRTALNTLRSFAGLAPVTFDDQQNHYALAAALLAAAQNHLPPSGDTGARCYSEDGYFGASRGTDFCLGCTSGAEAISGYVEHSDTRYGPLNPAAGLYGSGSTGRSNVLIATLGTDSLPTDEVVAWPNSGAVPWPLIPKTWTVTVGNTQSQYDVSFAAARVSIEIDGKRAGVQKLRDLGKQPSVGRALSWSVKIPKKLQTGSHRIDVSIGGVTIGGAAKPIDYSIKTFDVR